MSASTTLGHADQLAHDEKIARLTGEARERSWPNVRPVDASTLLIVDRSGPAPRVLMGKRHGGHKFMPNKYVFPGGRAEASDNAIPTGSELLPAIEAALIARTVRGTATRARRLALAAIRETFEETGLVIGKKIAAAGIADVSAHASGAQKASVAGVSLAGPWGEFLATGHLPDLGSLRYLARAITPPKRPKRFDTRFFAVESHAIQHTIGDIVGPDSELTELAWLTLAETMSLPLPAITRVVLADLDAALSNGGLWPEAPVPFYFERRRVFQREFIHQS